MWVLKSKGLLASEQCGFRKEKEEKKGKKKNRKKSSTADQLIRFDSFIRNAFAKN